jgi:hypothetical protein
MKQKGIALCMALNPTGFFMHDGRQLQAMLSPHPSSDDRCIRESRCSEDTEVAERGGSGEEGDPNDWIGGSWSGVGGADSRCNLSWWAGRGSWLKIGGYEPFVAYCLGVVVDDS